MNQTAALKRIARTNPELLFTLAHAGDDEMFENIVWQAVGAGEEIASFESLHLNETLDEVKSLIGPFAKIDEVAWKASRYTVVVQLKTDDGQNYRLWWWRHADNTEMGYEAHLYREAAAVTSIEMAWFE